MGRIERVEGFAIRGIIIDLNMKTEGERKWAIQVFNQMADYYDKYKPDYPEELIKQ